VAQQPELGEIADAAGLRAWADRLVVLHEEEDDPIRCPVGALVMEMAEDDPDVRAALDAGLTRWRDAVAAGLRRLQDAGEIPPSADATRLAEVLLAAYQGGVLLAQAHASSASLRLALETTVEGILAAP
jgi:TetR/AcrR family transcriptional regulator, transcriptional repressor for nem operon